MKMLPELSPRPLYLHLAQDLSKNILRGYPWVFSYSLKELPRVRSGSRALLKDKSGKIIAKGMYDPESQLVFRVCALQGEELDDQLIIRRMQSAISLRKSIISQAKHTNAYRLFNGEGDRLPGLVCDIYNNCAVFQLDGGGPEGFWQIEQIAAWVKEALSLDHCVLRLRSNKEIKSRLLSAKTFDGICEFVENGLRFRADVFKGQKTGFFLDQRDNRRQIGLMSCDKKVLNLFGYTGGFSVYAGAAKAKSVTTIDLAKPAIATAELNWKLNELTPPHQTKACDAFEFLEDAKRGKDSWQLVIADPPSFAPSQKLVEKAKASYLNLLTLCAQVTESGGILAASSCSSHINQEMFYQICEQAISKARARGTILGVFGQPQDHPFPLACPELRYLKFNVIKIER